MITQLWINQKCNETKFIEHSIRKRDASKILKYKHTLTHTYIYINIYVLVQIVHKFMDLSQAVSRAEYSYETHSSYRGNADELKSTHTNMEGGQTHDQFTGVKHVQCDIIIKTLLLKWSTCEPYFYKVACEKACAWPTNLWTISMSTQNIQRNIYRNEDSKLCRKTVHLLLCKRVFATT